MIDVRTLKIERLRRLQTEHAIRNELFDLQLALHDDPAQFRAAHPGRRGGKSEGIPRSAALLGRQAGFNEAVIIGAETQKKAKALHWANLHALVVRHKLPFVPNGQEGAFLSPWGARIQFWGLADNNAVELLRGFKLRGVLLDETQFYSSKLTRLISTVLEPALGDTGGPCTLYGTPSVTRSGEWADICLGRTPGWSVHHWDVRQNKRFPREVESMLAQVLKRNNWTWDHPTFQREWLGLFVDDPSMQVFKYSEARNTADCLPVPASQGFCTLAIDYGTTDDPCAWVLLWSPRGSREIYVVLAEKHHGLLPDDAAQITRSLIEEWRPQRIVGDGGGLGAPYVAAYNRRYGHLGAYVTPADKLGVLGQIALVNGELESGRIKVLPGAMDLAAEWQALPWKDGTRTAVASGYHDHCADALRYGFTAHFADIPVVPAPEPTSEELERAAIAERHRVARQRSAGGLLRR